jgi:hypothetical protein
LFDNLRIRRHLVVGRQACVRRWPVRLRIWCRRLVRALMGHAKRGVSLRLGLVMVFGLQEKAKS